MKIILTWNFNVRCFDQNIGDRRSTNQLIITGIINAQKSQQITTAGYQYQTQTPVISNPNINKTGTTENTLPTEVIQTSNPTSSALIPDTAIPLHVLKTNFRSNS